MKGNIGFRFCHNCNNLCFSFIVLLGHVKKIKKHNFISLPQISLPFIWHNKQKKKTVFLFPK